MGTQGANQPNVGYHSLPVRNDHGTPKWEEGAEIEMESVNRYFDEVERLIAKAQLTDETEKKKAACNYVPSSVAKYWKNTST